MNLHLVLKFLRHENIVRNKIAVCFEMRVYKGNVGESTAIQNHAFYFQILVEI